MKQILLAIASVCLIQADAIGQDKNPNAKNYSICLYGNTYSVCDQDAAKVQPQGIKTIQKGPSPALSMLNTDVNMGYRKTSGYSNRRNSRILVSYDDPNAPYEGKESRSNDGVEKNKLRNINYLDGSMQLPPNDGTGAK